MATKIQLRRGTAAAWTTANPVLSSGEPGFESNTGRAKVGDGSTAWTALPYLDAVAAQALALAQSVESSSVRNADADDPINTAQILQGVSGYNPDGSGLPNFALPPVVGFSTGGIYTAPDTTNSNIFHLSSYAYNNTVGAAPTVAVFGFGKGDRAFGANFVGYTDGHGIAQGVEVDYGNVGAASTTVSGDQALPVATLNVASTAGAASTGIVVASGNFGRYTGITPTSFTGISWEVGGTGTLTNGSAVTYSTGGSATGVTIVAIGSNIGGSPPGVFLQMQAQVASQGSHGVNFNSSSRPAVQPSGTLVRATGERCAQGVGLLGSQFSTAAALLPVNSGSTASTVGMILQAEGGFANAGAFIDMRAFGAGSSVTDGIRFRLSGGVQPVTGSLIKCTGAITAAIGLDLVAGAFSAAGVAMGDNNITTGTVTGTKIGTATTQKLGFWGAAPITRPAVSGAITPGSGAASLVAALANAGLVTDSTTPGTAAATWADLAASYFRPSRYAAATMLDDATVAASGIVLPSASGQVYAALLPLLATTVVTGLGAFCSSIGSGITHLWYVLMDANRNVLGVTADLVGSLAVAEIFAPLAGGPVTTAANTAAYFGILATWTTTAPSFRGFTSATQTTGQARIRAGLSTTGYTTAPPNVNDTLAAMTASGAIIYGGAY